MVNFYIYYNIYIHKHIHTYIYIYIYIYIFINIKNRGKPETVHRYWPVSEIYRIGGQTGTASGIVLTSLAISQDARRYFLIESGFALFVAFLINVAIVSVSGTVCSANNISNETANQCNDLNLKSASFLLKVQIYIYEIILH